MHSGPMETSREVAADGLSLVEMFEQELLGIRPRKAGM